CARSTTEYFDVW
nr:immunoglobulin heavy chain junction region [Mus musculus]MBK4187031.1 immunoglobulin heavy chain junction region [Mus musculus]MBK4195295.1 immunoglobulin heavy chain junction region [Mus musculus]